MCFCLLVFYSSFCYIFCSCDVHLLASTSFQLIISYIENSASTSVLCCNHIWTWELLSCPLFSPNVHLDLVSRLVVISHLVFAILMSLSLWQPEWFTKLVTEVSVELQPLSFFFIQEEAIDVGEQLFWCHRGDEALSVQSELVQQHHAEVGSGDSEHLSTERHISAGWSLKELHHLIHKCH